MLEVQWKCPNCGCVNTDDMLTTAKPLCELCDCTWEEWIEIVPQEQVDEMNRLLREREKHIV